jgi:hypothetical protein
MRYTIEIGPHYIKAEMIDRDTAEETREFVDAVLAALREHKLPRVLISTRESRPLYKVESWNLSGTLEQLAGMQGLKVALLSDSKELAMSQQYIELLAQQRGLAFKTFKSEKPAAQWLMA